MRSDSSDVSHSQACAVMALERVPADIRADGGVARMVSGSDVRVMQVRGCILQAC